MSDIFEAVETKESSNQTKIPLTFSATIEMRDRLDEKLENTAYKDRSAIIREAVKQKLEELNGQNEALVE